MMVGDLARRYEQLFAILGPQSWWPAESRFEIIVGAVLTQNTSWRNVQRAIENLRQANALDIASLSRASTETVAHWIRPSGYYRLKAQRLKNVVQFITDQCGGSLDAMFARPQSKLRDQLLQVHGVGPETADAILLYAGGLPAFVVDAYTARIGGRHAWFDPQSDYHAIQARFESELPRDVQVYNEFHAMIVQVGKQYCHKRQAACDSCPLRFDLPAAGPRPISK